MSRVDVMIDIETLGTNECPPVFQLTAKAFNIKTGEIISTFNDCCDISTSTSIIDKKTILWWVETNPALFAKLLLDGKNSKHTEEQMIINFIEWFNSLDSNNKNIFLWGNGVNFDNRIIAAKCRQYNLVYPVFYRNDMDMRTIIEIAAMKMGFTDQKSYRDTIKFEGTEHNAECDVNNQIKQLIKAYTDLTK